MCVALTVCVSRERHEIHNSQLIGLYWLQRGGDGGHMLLLFAGLLPRLVHMLLPRCYSLIGVLLLLCCYVDLLSLQLLQHDIIWTKVVSTIST